MKQVLALFSILFYTSLVFAQEPNDCINAIIVCGNNNFISDATGIGTKQEVSGCGGFEHNSIWLKITIVQGGTLGFDLIPNNPSILVDYDFWVFGPNKTCGTGLGSPIRCATTNPNLSGASDNHTGMYVSTTATQIGPGAAGGNGYVRWLTVTAGQFYYICVDRPVGDGGFTLQWTGSATLGTGAFPPTPLANTIPDYKSCSTTPNVSIFDLTSVSTQINPDLVSNTIDYYPTLAKAIDQLSPLSNLMNNATNPQVVYARVTDTSSGCYAISSFNLIVNTIPIVAMTSTSTSICAGDTATIAFTGSPNATIEYTVAGNVQTAVLDATGVFTLIQSLTTTTTYGLTKVTSTDALGATICTQNLTNSMVITVKPIPIVIASPTSSTICSGTNTTINLTSSTPGTTFSWIAAQTGVSGAISDSGNIINQLVSTTGTSSGTVKYTITPTANGCAGLPIDEIITVNPIPVGSATPLLAAICSGDAINIVLNSTLSGTTFDWTVAANSVSGTSNGNGTSINQTLSNLGMQLGSAVYTIIPSALGCTGNTIVATVHVNPLLSATITGTTTLCSGTSSTVHFVGNPNATLTYTINNGSNQTVLLDNTGIAAVLTGNLTADTTYQLIKITDSGIPFCEKMLTGAAVISVIPIPIINANVASNSICSGQSTGITLSSTAINTSYSWTVSPSGVMGASAGNGNAITQNLSNLGIVPDTVIYTIKASVGSCQIPNLIVPITVNPEPIVTLTPSMQTICSSTSTAISLSSSIVGATFAWTAVQSGVTGAVSGTGASIHDFLSVLTTVGTATYSITPTANNCSGAAKSCIVTVNPEPIPTLSDGAICVNQSTNVPFQTYILDSQLSTTGYDFVWYWNGNLITENNSTHEATHSGTYGVKATNSATGCVSQLTSAQVIATFPGLMIDTIQTSAFSDTASLIVSVSGGNGTYLYSLDTGPYQQSNIFSAIEPGLHTVIVTDTTGCTHLSKTVKIIGYPKYFTPNGDGIHDTWTISGLDASSKICIYDRYGKMIHVLLPKSLGWDGTLNGYALPSNDYWFTVDYIELGEKKVFKSHFTLKR